MKNPEKTNVMRVLDQKRIGYEAHTYTPDPTLTGEEIAQVLGEDASRVFKTLVTRGKSGAYHVFVVPVTGELDLKKAAKVSGEGRCHDKTKRTASAYGICPRRMFSYRHEEGFSDIHS